MSRSITVFRSDTGGITLFETVGQRLEAVGSLSDAGYNWFVGFVDSEPGYPVGLSFGIASEGTIPVFKDCIRLVH